MTNRALFAALFAALLLLVLATCVDFGYDIPPPPAEYDAAPTPTFDADPNAPDGMLSDAGSGCIEGPTDPTEDGPQIRFTTLNVDQNVLNIAAGDTVTWTNGDTMKHTVTVGAPGAELPPELGGFDSGDIFPSAQWAYRFCDARTVIYFCATHPLQMSGYRVLVAE